MDLKPGEELEWRDSGQAPFHYSGDEYERVGAYGIVCVYICVRRRAHSCVHHDHVLRVPLGMYVICVHHCICVCLCFLVVYIACDVCSGG